MKAWETFKEYFMITVGVAIVAVSVYFLLVPSHVTVGSISGLSIILEYFIPLPLSVITFILNAILLVVGFLLIGKDFGIKTVYTSLMMPVMMGVLERIYPDVQSIMKDPFLDMIVYIFIVSIGQAVMFRYNASSGGLDIVGKVLNKYMHIELGRAISMAGMLVALSSILTSDLNMVILSILGTSAVLSWITSSSASTLKRGSVSSPKRKRRSQISSSMRCTAEPPSMRPGALTTIRCAGRS